jgi:hypothetical protein
MDILQTKVRIKLILAHYTHTTNGPNANNNDFFSSLKTHRINQNKHKNRLQHSKIPKKRLKILQNGQEA